MPNRNARPRRRMTPAEIIAAYLDERNDDLLDAIMTAAALVARADGRIEPAERGLLVDFMDRNGFLSVFTRREILDAFERRIREFDEPGVAEVALDELRRLAGRSPARFVIGAGKRVAGADGRFHPGELEALRLIRHALGAAPASAAASHAGTGGTR